MTYLALRQSTFGCCACPEMGEFCTDLFFTADGLLPTDAPLLPSEPETLGPPLEFIVDPLPPTPTPGTTFAPPTPPPPALPPAIVDSPDSELEVAMLGMFSFAARSIAELRRIMIVLVWGSISSRCSMLLLFWLLLLAVVPPTLC